MQKLALKIYEIISIGNRFATAEVVAAAGSTGTT
jgi:hypothetical protein